MRVEKIDIIEARTADELAEVFRLENDDTGPIDVHESVSLV